MTEATLKEGEAHPSAIYAMGYVRKYLTGSKREALASCAIENNRAAEIMLSTVRRLDSGQPVSDRYILGLAWWVALGDLMIELDFEQSKGNRE